MLGLIRRIRRRRLLRRPIPPRWRSILDSRVPFYGPLPAGEKERFLDALRIFLAEKRFTGVGGVEITDEKRVLVAAAAALVVVNLGIDYLDRLSEVILYPESFYNPDADEERSGETHEWGVVMLSWQDVDEDFECWGDGMNTAIHEFAHVLDRAAGDFQGATERWAKVMNRHFWGLRKGRKRERRVLDEYGGENEAEFFAVATEAFFGIPGKMKRHTPDLYRELSRLYRADPLAWGL